MILSPRILAELVSWEGGIDLAGLALTLREVCKPAGMGELRRDSRKLPDCKPLRDENGVYTLAPGAYIVRYNEVVEVPRGFAAFAMPRSSLLRMGAVLYTAVWDPGYRGRGVGLLNVLNEHGIRLERGAQIAQLVFVPIIGETGVYRGVYQNEGV